jgi:excisionase family DNA binding protein
MSISIRKQRDFETNTIDFQHIDVKDIAGYCMVSTNTVRRWLDSGKLKSIRLPSNRYRVSVKDFREFLKCYNIPIRNEFFTD